VALGKVGKNGGTPYDRAMVRGWKQASTAVLDDSEVASVAGDDRR
jgi:hypothetical protein